MSKVLDLIATLSGNQTTKDVTAVNSPLPTDDSKKLATTDWCKLGFAVSLGVNGYIKLPTWLSGLMLQWGTKNGINNTAATNVSFNTPFPNACFAVMATHVSPGTSPATRNVEVVIRAVSYFDAYGNTTANAIYWFAVGH